VIAARVTGGSPQSSPLFARATRICVVNVPFAAIVDVPPGRFVTQADGPTPVPPWP
jgi:hypothetical protein